MDHARHTEDAGNAYERQDDHAAGLVFLEYREPRIVVAAFAALLIAATVAG